MISIAQYIHFTEDQKFRANSVDLAEYLRRQGEKLIPSGREKRLASNHSITVRGNQWFDHATGDGGLAIDFIQRYYDLTFPDAVTLLLGGERCEIYAPVKDNSEPERKPFVLPPANSDMRRAYAYLLQKRFIDREVLTAFVHDKLIYESCELSKDGAKEYHNAVFVGFDEHGVARHAHKRGLYTEGKGYRGNMDGSDPAYSFHYIGTNERLYVFEAPIDLLSFISLYPEEWRRSSYVALCGTSEHALLKLLGLYPNMQSVVICLDHDIAGIEATERIADKLRDMGYTSVATLRPQNKDWNEDVKAKQGHMPEPAEEHPQLIACAEICEMLPNRCNGVRQVNLKKQFADLLERYRNHLHNGCLDKAASCMEQLAALLVSLAAREYHQMGDVVTNSSLCAVLRDRFRPYANRSKAINRRDEFAMKIQSVLALKSSGGVRSQKEKESLADAYLDIALDCVKVLVRLNMCVAQKLGQKQSSMVATQTI